MGDLVGTKGAPGVWQRIISEMPEHDVYVEPFWGRGTIARKKRPAAVTIGCDLDPAAIENGGVLGAMMFLTDGVQFLTDYFRVCDSETGDDATSSPAAVFRDAAEYRSTAATFGGFPLSRHFVYLDPPYLGCGLQYYTWFRRWIERHEISEEDWHRQLCRFFLWLPCPAALSGYHSDVYADELGDARAIEIPTVNRSGQAVTEVLWMNYPEPVRYHDTRFVGTDRRDRERIRRRVANWLRGLQKMPPRERQVMLDAIQKEYLR